VRAALQVLDNIARALQHVGDSGYMPWLARMARAQQCDLMLLIAETLDTTSGDEWQRLQRLQRAARERQRFRIAGGIEQPAMAVDDGDGTVCTLSTTPPRVTSASGTWDAIEMEWDDCGADMEATMDVNLALSLISRYLALVRQRRLDLFQ
jgi:hypothetical protein